MIAHSHSAIYLPLPLATTFLHRSGIPLIRALISSIEILSHSFNSTSFKYAIVFHSFNFDIQLAVLKYSSRSRMGSNQKIEDESTFQRNETSLTRLTTLSFDRVP